MARIDRNIGQTGNAEQLATRPHCAQLQRHVGDDFTPPMNQTRVRSIVKKATAAEIGGKTGGKKAAVSTTSAGLIFRSVTRSISILIDAAFAALIQYTQTLRAQAKTVKQARLCSGH